MSGFDLDAKFDLNGAKEFSVVFLDGSGQEKGLFEPIDNPYNLNLNEFTPETGYLDLERLYELASQLVDWKQAQEGVEEASRCKLVKEWPKQPLANQSDAEIISVRLIKREPAKLSADGSKFQHRRPRWAREFTSEHTPAHTVTILQQQIDHELEFVCWAADSLRADQRALWLERLFIQYSWVFLSEGAERWHFICRNSDIVLRQNEHTYHQRPLRFFARLSELEAQYDPTIRNFEFHTSIHP